MLSPTPSWESWTKIGYRRSILELSRCFIHHRQSPPWWRKAFSKEMGRPWSGPRLWSRVAFATSSRCQEPRSRRCMPKRLECRTATKLSYFKTAVWNQWVCPRSPRSIKSEVIMKKTDSNYCSAPRLPPSACSTYMRADSSRVDVQEVLNQSQTMYYSKNLASTLECFKN
jgi:hypothetical protein